MHQQAETHWHIHIIECYQAIKKEQTTDKCNKINEFQKHYAESEKSHAKENIWHDFIYI